MRIVAGVIFKIKIEIEYYHIKNSKIYDKYKAV